MKNFRRLLQFVALLMLGSVPGSAQASCPVRLPAQLELRGEELSLADLLQPDACPVLRRAAAQVSLGKTPRQGSMRVLEKAQVEGWLELAVRNAGTSIETFQSPNIPERIVIRREGMRSSCFEIARQLHIPLDKAGDLELEDCGAAQGIRRGAQFAVERRIWDPALESWEFMVRCGDPADCVPFLLRVRGSFAPDSIAMPTAWRSGAVRPGSKGKIRLRAGQRTTLVWKQNGIRMVLPVVSLDAGNDGDIVRARVRSSTLLITAKVTPDATLVRGQ